MVGEIVEVVRIGPEAYETWWPDISKQLDTVPQTWNKHWTKEALFEAGMRGVVQVWGFGLPKKINLIVYTQVVEYPASKILQVILAFGNSLDSCLPTLEATFERYAQVMECDRCEVFGRGGWERKLGGRFKRDGVILSCEVKKQGVH